MGALEAIEAALDASDASALDAAVDAFTDSREPIDAADLERVCATLEEHRRFAPLLRVADAGLQRGFGGPLWGHAMQCLIEQGAYTAATALAERAIAQGPVGATDRVALHGLAGRVSKDLYLATGEPGHVQRSLAEYTSAWEDGSEDQKLWLGINSHAVANLATRAGVDVDLGGVESAAELLVRAKRAAAADPADHWALATEVEAHLALGLGAPADAIVDGLGGAPPFVHASLRRQLVEVWGLGDDDPAVVTLAELLLRDGGTDGEVEVVLPADAAGYEKIFGNEWPIPIETYREGLRAATSVCHLLVDGTFPAGTGFVVDGGELHPSLAGRAAMLTNEHVVPSLDRDGVRAEELRARFDGIGGDPVGGLRAVYWSDREDLDVTILVSDELDRADVPPLAPGWSLPTVRSGAHVYVVGHPGGAGLQLSIRGNDLIDHDGRLIHYRAPTSRGSSGSPVFDQTWKLIGVHHRGSPKLPALGGKTGRYEGNEGTSLLALRDQLAERPPAT